MEVKTRNKKSDVKNILNAAELFPTSEAAKRVLHKRAEHYAQHKEEHKESASATAYIRFKLGANEYYGIPYQFAKEVLHYTSITKVPRTPDFIAGVINRHSTLISVIDLKNIFHTVQSEYDENAYIIIVQLKQLMIGILADSMEGSASFNTETLSPPIASEGITKTEYVLGLHDGNTTIINMEALLSDPDILIKKTNTKIKE